MKLSKRTLSVACLLIALAWSAPSQAQYLLTGGSGGGLQIGTGLPLPVAPIFLGGMVPATAGTPFWPSLLVPPAPGASAGGGLSTITIKQTLGTTQGGKMLIPTGVLSRPAPGAPAGLGVFPTNPTVFQVLTTIDYAWPAAAATLMPGGAPGPGVFTTATAGGIISYSGGTKAFGGSGQFVVTPGTGAAGGRVPPNGGGVLPVASVWINFGGALPSTAGAAAIVGASAPLGVGQAGAPVTAPPGTTMFGPLSPGAGPFGALNVGTVTVTPSGAIASSIPLPTVMVGPMGSITLAGLSNMVTGSKGFPWTTGLITVSQPGATPTAEVFFLSGTDMRVAGVGNVSLVSGALSTRALSGPNANRGWLSLTLATPEPTLIAGTAGALGILALCHGLVRRRRSN